MIKFLNGPGVRFPRVIIHDGAGHYLQLPSLTTTERNALTPAAGMLIYNSTLTELESYENGSWVATGKVYGDATFLKLAGGTLSGATKINDDILFSFGNGSDIVMLNRSTSLIANTALTNVLVGTVVLPALPANSLIISNITASGSIALVCNNGGNSQVGLLLDIPNDLWRAYSNGVEFLRVDGVTISTQSIPITVGAGYYECLERVAPGAGAANTARIYAVVGGDTLTDLAAVFQDGTVDIFAQEATPLDSPLLTKDSGTKGELRIRKPHPGLKIIEMVFSDGTVIPIKTIEHHDASIIAADKGAEGPLPVGWEVTTAAERAAKAMAEKMKEPV